MKTTGRYELTATKDSDGIKAVMTTYHRTRKEAESAAHVSREFGWATWIVRV